MDEVGLEPVDIVLICTLSAAVVTQKCPRLFTSEVEIICTPSRDTLIQSAR
jgi:hypothetical protein